VRRHSIRIVAAAIFLGALAGCASDDRRSDELPGDPERGRAAITEYGCASCHSIPGVPSVGDDSVAPDLQGFADRHFIAGQIPNRTEELIEWLMNPQAIEPGTLMPDLGVTQEDAEDIAAYLSQH
jgi:cytochrome c